MIIWLLIAQMAIPPEFAPAVLNATVHVQQDKGRWTYTICNNEAGFQIMTFQFEKIDVRQALVEPPVGWRASMYPDRTGVIFGGGYIRQGQCVSSEIKVNPNIEVGQVRYRMQATSEEDLKKFKTDPQGAR